MKMISIRLTYKFFSFLCLCFIFKNKVLAQQNCQVFAITVIFTALPIFLTPRKYLCQGFEIMTTQMGKATKSLIYVDHNYYFSCWYPRLFFYPQRAGSSYGMYFMYKRMLKVGTIFHVSLVILDHFIILHRFQGLIFPHDLQWFIGLPKFIYLFKALIVENSVFTRGRLGVSLVQAGTVWYTLCGSIIRTILPPVFSILKLLLRYN